MKRMWNSTGWLFAMGVIAGCGQVQPLLDDEESELGEGKYEAWNEANNPAYVDNTFVYEIDKLPLKGAGRNAPIPADYWPVYKDSVNVRWDGEQSQSAVEKYEKAFNKTGIVKAVTEKHGIYGFGRKECTTGTECADLKDGSECVYPRGISGDKKGRCIPTWWGICHGWSPYAISEPAPMKAVTKNGVTFYPGDLEGLMSLAYSNGLQTKFISQRCNKKEPGFDNTGRVVEAECRDMNPGTWHIVVTNMLGLRQVGFVYDRTATDQVWNQPVRDFTITNGDNGKLKEITKAEAVTMLGLDLNFTSLLAATPLKKDEKKLGSWTANVAGEVVIKTAGTGDADLFASLNVDATEDKATCRSTGGTSSEECRLVVKVGDKVSYLLKGYADVNTASVSVGTKAGMPNYVYNQAAKRFFFVVMDFRYISESGPARESRVAEIDSHTRADHYEYLLETDDKARIIGGEWVGDSRKAHPDFVWWPVAKPRPVIANGLITFDEVKALHDESSAIMNNPMNQPEVKVLATDVVVNASSNYTTIGVPAGATLKVDVTGTGNVDLYVRLGARPTVTTFACKSTGPTSSETCTVKAPQAGGTFYVRARPTGVESKVTIKATITR